MNEKLWAIYVPGPDEYHAMPSRDAAELAARQHNSSGCIEHIADQLGMEPASLLVSVCEWPGDADDHADELADALHEARAAALQRIAMAAGVDHADPGHVADIVCAELNSPLGPKMHGIVCHMMRAADELAAGVEALGAVMNRHAEALDECMCTDEYSAVVALGEAESELTECRGRVVRQAQRYGRLALRARGMLTESRSAAAAAAAALATLGEGAAQ